MLRNYWPLSFMGRRGAGGSGPISTLAPTPLLLASNSPNTAAGAAITFSSEQYDPSNIIVVTSGTITIPSSGLYRVMGTFGSADPDAVGIYKNGAPVIGGQLSRLAAADPNWGCGGSAILNLAASDTIQFIAEGGSNFAFYTARFNCGAVERLEAGTQYALVRKSADQVVGSVPTTLSFPTEVADIGGWHDGANDSRLTVFSGLTRVRITANLNSSANVAGHIIKNGSATAVPGLPYAGKAITPGYISLFSPPLNVTAGDYFEAVADIVATYKNHEGTWFSIEEVPAAIKSCLVYHSTTQGISSGAETTLAFDSEDHDPNGMHSTVSNTSRLTVPSGCTYARLIYNVKCEGVSTASVQARLTKNADVAIVYGGTDAHSGLNQRVHGCTGWQAVTPGDYFELRAFGVTGTATASGGTAGTWFAMECI